MSGSDLGILQEHNNISVLCVENLLLRLLSLKAFLLLLQLSWNRFLLKRPYYSPLLLVFQILRQGVRCELIVYTEDMVLGF